MGSITQKLIAKAVDRALYRNQLPRDSPLRIELETWAEIAGGYEPEIQVRDESNSLVTLDQRIDQLRDYSNFSQFFPPEPPRVSRHNEAKLRENFSKIASGEVVVSG